MIEDAKPQRIGTGRTVLPQAMLETARIAEHGKRVYITTYSRERDTARNDALAHRKIDSIRQNLGGSNEISAAQQIF